jgi:F-type H+-transporting ATPase subunit a
LKNPFVQLLVVLAASALFCVAPAVLLPRAGIPVAFPHVQMPTEKVFLEPLFNIGTIPVYLFNTLPSVILADIILLVMALTAGAAARKRLRQYEADHMSVDEEGHDQMVPKGWLNAFEAILEYIYNLVESVVGSKWADKVFPLIMTIFLFVLTINWLHFVPGVDSIGIVHCAEPGKAKGFEIAELGNSGIYRLATSSEVGATGVAPTYGEEACQQAHHAAVGGEHDEQAEKPEILYTIAPFMRTASTDLNITLSIALVAVVSVQVFGVRELGIGYFTKFFNVPAIRHGALGYVELGVSLIEIVSEIMKIVAFSLRLFGNMFAGAILLFVMMFLIPVGVPVIFFLLEVLIGAIQAFVFALLTLVFVSLAMIGHGDHDDEEHG